MHYKYICMHLWPWRWPHEWPKHVGDHYVIKYIIKRKCICWSSTNFMYLINALDMEHIKMTLLVCHQHRGVWEVAFWGMRSLNYILCQQPRYLGAAGNVPLSNILRLLLIFVEISQFFVIWLWCGLLLLGKIVCSFMILWPWSSFL